MVHFEEHLKDLGEFDFLTEFDYLPVPVHEVAIVALLIGVQDAVSALAVARDACGVRAIGGGRDSPSVGEEHHGHSHEGAGAGPGDES